MADKNLRFTVVLSALDNATRVINSAVNGAITRLNTLNRRADSISKSAFAFGRDAGAIGLAVAAPLFMSVKAAEEAEIAVKKLDRVFKNMGDTTGDASKQAAAYASALQMKIGVDDEEIVAAQTKLATFSKVVSKQAREAGIFNRTTAALYDLQAAGFGDAASNATKVGKMLQDPIKNLQALNRAGIQFTKQEQKKIEELMKSGKLLAAQDMILKKIEGKVGGVAEASASSSSKARAAWGEVMEQLGGALLPTIQSVADMFINKVVPAIQKFVSENGTLVSNVAKGLAIFASLSLVVSGLSFVFGGIFKVVSIGARVFSVLSTVFGVVSKAVMFLGRVMLANPILLIIAAIAVAAFLIIKNWDKVKAFFIRLWDGVKDVFSKVWNFIKKLFLNYTPQGLIIKHWDKITAFFRNLWDGVVKIFHKAVNFVKKIFLNFTPLGIIIKNFDNIVNWLEGFGKKLYHAGKNIIKQIWEGIKSMVSKPIEAVKGMVKKIRDFLPFSPAKDGPFRDLHRVKIVETIAQTIKPAGMVTAMRKAVTATMAVAMMPGGVVAGPKAMPINKNISQSSQQVTSGDVHITYNPTITIGGGTAQDKVDFARELEKHKSDIMQMITDANNRKERLKFG